MSYHDPSSDVSRINRDGVLGEVKVSSHTTRVLAAARDLAEESDGLFDVTVAPALCAAGVLPRRGRFPRVSPRGDWRHVEVDRDGRVRLTRPVRIDLGGIAKGYAVDRAIETLRSLGAHAARVNAGGDLRVLGARPHTVRIRRPNAPTMTCASVTVERDAAATSADYFGRRRRQGRRLSSIVDPRSRVPFPASGRSATVLASDCLTADAVAKIVFVDPERALPVLTAHGARAVIFDGRSDDRPAGVFDARLSLKWLSAEEAECCGGHLPESPAAEGTGHG